MIVEHDPGDLESYADQTIPDPWNDPEQTDWPNHTITVKEVIVSGANVDPCTQLGRPAG